MNKWRQSIFIRSMVVILSFTMIEQAYSISPNTNKKVSSISTISIQVLLQNLFNDDCTEDSESTAKSDPLSDSLPEQQDSESEEEGFEEDDLKLLLSLPKTSYLFSIKQKDFNNHDLGSLGFMLGKIPTPPPEA